MPRAVSPESTAKLLTWKHRYETDPTVTLRQIADDIGTSHTYVDRHTKKLNWIKAKHDKKSVEQKINSYKLQYETDSSLTVLRIAAAIDVPYYVVRDWIVKNKWVKCQRIKKVKSTKNKKVKIIKEDNTPAKNSNAKQLAKFSSIFSLANSLTHN